ncbi:hypothetical protein [Rhizobium sp. RU36D]|uniref:hypothetical protein n=1 Tax=Rhizobium sp. RU36D TaxID=1907415 RepID=UPI0009D8496E|nr:hypothetical protein [Rhizobium sp. RU36D]SMD18480.1 hypothetical protein SAMN05880593_13514 [Rhizobium sp. RU36D]
MSVDLKIDDKDLAQLRRAIERLPGEIKTKAMRRAMSRLTAMAKTRIVARNAPHTKMPPALVRAMTTGHFNAGGNSSRLVVQSGWVHLQKLGAVQTDSGVFVNLRGSYKHAFQATMKSGHVGIFARILETQMPGVKHKREQIVELFAANPAHAITKKPDIYLEVLAELIESHLFPRYAHEVTRLLPA